MLFFAQLPAAAAATHHPQAFLHDIQGRPNEGKLIVDHFCANCHAAKPLISLGAPKIGEKADWQERLSQGIALLLQHTEEGYNAMPPRGGCFECSDHQLKLAVKAMLPQLKSTTNPPAAPNSSK